jgi:uncharacterized protein (TIGR02145 family)
MKALRFSICIVVVLCSLYMNEVLGQWNSNGAHIYNTNSGNVGIGNNSPSTLLYVGKNMTEPAITVRNLGGSGGATYVMTDNASGANWKFKATSTGGFKIRDYAYLLEVFTIEPNSTANALYIKTGGNVGIRTSNPASSAALDISSTTKGYLPPRMIAADIAVMPNPANGLMVFNTTDEHIYQYSSSANIWKRIPYEGLTACGIPFIVTHTANYVAPVTKTVTYGTVWTNLSGSNKCWITQNLGADHQAASATDATEASAGWYWQFYDYQGYKHDGTTRTPNTTWHINFPDPFFFNDWEPAYDPCLQLLGQGWRIPTSTEWHNARQSGGWENYNETYASVLKLHAAGFLSVNDGNLVDRGNKGYYWSSSSKEPHEDCYAYALYFNSSSCYVESRYWALGSTVRCLKD